MRTTPLPSANASMKRTLAMGELGGLGGAAKRPRRSIEFSREFDLLIESEFEPSNLWEDLVQRQQQSMSDELSYSSLSDDGMLEFGAGLDYTPPPPAPIERKRRRSDVSRLRGTTKRLYCQACPSLEEVNKEWKVGSRDVGIGLKGTVRAVGGKGVATPKGKRRASGKPPLSPRMVARPAVPATAAYVEGKARLLAMVGKAPR